MFKHHTFLLLSVFMIILSPSRGQNTLMKILEDELEREMIEFKKEKYSPYYISYRVNDDDFTSVASSFGSVTRIDTSRLRKLNVAVRIGNYQKDNTHLANNGEYFGGIRGTTANLPREDVEEAITHVLWQQTDAAYKAAVEAYKNMELKEATEKADTISDFTKEKPEIYSFKEGKIIKADVNEWKERLNKLSDRFNSDKNFISGGAYFSYKVERKYFVSSEGTKITQLQTYCYLHVNGMIRATDGMICPLAKSYFGFTPEELPGEDQLIADVDDLIQRLINLRNAPLADPYEGPAILSPKAAGVFFHEIFGHRVEGHRTRQKTDSQTFNGKMGENILPKGFNVVFDPGIKYSDNHLLSGNYMFDDEGVKGQKVTVVADGKLHGFLNSRCPTATSTNSNGHGRAMAGVSTVTRQSNMLVSTDNPFSKEKLRKQLIKACKKLDKPYGYLFKEVSGGFTQVSRFMPNAFNVTPLEVFRVYTDGRPDELVRGVNLIGTPLAMFAEIESAGLETEVFNGFCGAESGAVPVSTVAPALFVRQIETQKKIDMESSKTILTRPGLKTFK